MNCFFYKKIVLIFFLLVSSKIFCSFPLSHVYFAQIWFQKESAHRTADKEKSFFLGTLYPDIRYLEGSSRGKTHSKVSLEDLISEKNFFKKGKKLHCFVDEIRNRLIVKEKIQELFPKFTPREFSFFLKLLEDEILYDQVFPFSKTLLSYLKAPTSEEIFEGSSSQTVSLWHEILKIYFSERPSALLQNLGSIDKDFYGISPETFEKWKRIFPIYAEDPRIKNYVKKLVLEFETEFSRKTTLLKSQ